MLRRFLFENKSELQFCPVWNLWSVSFFNSHEICLQILSSSEWLRHKLAEKVTWQTFFFNSKIGKMIYDFICIIANNFERWLLVNGFSSLTVWLNYLTDRFNYYTRPYVWVNLILWKVGDIKCHRFQILSRIPTKFYLKKWK